VRSTDDGVTWTQPATFAADALSDRMPRVVSSAGVWIVAWTLYPVQFNTLGSEIRYSRSIDGGVAWTAPSNLNAAADASFHFGPRVASDGAGEWGRGVGVV
jgi:hypothetical protein